MEWCWLAAEYYGWILACETRDERLRVAFQRAYAVARRLAAHDRSSTLRAHHVAARDESCAAQSARLPLTSCLPIALCLKHRYQLPRRHRRVARRAGVHAH